MANQTMQADIDSTFYAAEQAGLKLAIKGRLVALLLIGLWMATTRGPERAIDFIIAIAVFGALGVLHYRLIGTKLDRRWLKYAFLFVDILLISIALVVAPPSPGTPLPQIFMFQFDVFPFYFVLLAVAAFSFSPGLVFWAGLLGGLGWLGAFAWVVSDMDTYVDWSDLPAKPGTDEFLEIFLHPEFIGTGTRIQETIIFLLVAGLISIVMRRARQTVRNQLEAEREMGNVSQMFGRFVPEVIVDSMIKDKGALDPIERQATVLFIDLAGFTSLTEAKGPRAIVDILNTWFDGATEIIGNHHGVVTQFQGDAILAIFNVPLEHEDHAQQAFNASRALLDLVRQQSFAGEKLTCRIGLNTGPLIAGNVGGGGRQTYTVHGDAVNLAARLEALNKDYGTSLLASQSTAELLTDSGLEKIGETNVRGLSEPVGLFTLN
jgi:adenylate cyclase